MFIDIAIPQTIPTHVADKAHRLSEPLERFAGLQVELNTAAVLEKHPADGADILAAEENHPHLAGPVVRLTAWGEGGQEAKGQETPEMFLQERPESCTCTGLAIGTMTY